MTERQPPVGSKPPKTSNFDPSNDTTFTLTNKTHDYFSRGLCSLAKYLPDAWNEASAEGSLVTRTLLICVFGLLTCPDDAFETRRLVAEYDQKFLHGITGFVTERKAGKRMQGFRDLVESLLEESRSRSMTELRPVEELRSEIEVLKSDMKGLIAEVQRVKAEREELRSEVWKRMMWKK